MVLFNFLPNTIFKLSMVQHIMGHIIKQVAQYKAGKKSIQQIYWQRPSEKKIKCSRQWNTCRWRHHQSLRIIRIIVVYTMEYKMNAFSPFRGGIKMEDETVQHILCERPDQQAQNKLSQEH